MGAGALHLCVVPPQGQLAIIGAERLLEYRARTRATVLDHAHLIVMAPVGVQFCEMKYSHCWMHGSIFFAGWDAGYV